MPSLKQVVANLEFYLDSWLDLAHGLHGFIVDPRHVQLAVIAPDCVSQATLLLGHLNLFEKTQQQKYLEQAMKEAEWLLANYIWETNFFYNSCFEHKPASSEAYTTLFGNAYATLALARLCNVLKKQNVNYTRFFNVAKNNIERFIIARCWDSKRTFLEFSYDERVFNLSSASTTIRALLEYAKLIQNESLIGEYCIPASKQILRWQYKDGCFTLDEKDEFAPLFQCALTIKGLMELYKHKKDEAIFDRIKDAAGFIAKNVHPKENLFYYGYHGDFFLKFPLYIAQSAVIASVLKQFSGFKLKFDIADNVLAAVYAKQYGNGALPSFNSFCNVLDKTKTMKSKRTHWQDVLPCPCWNAFAFEYLTELLPANSDIPLSTATFPCNYEASDYSIKERDSTLVFFAKDGSLAAKWFKRHDTWLFGKLYTTKRPKKERPGVKEEEPKEEHAKPKEPKKPKRKAKRKKAVRRKHAKPKKPLFGFLFKK
ncbi:MAG: hypothetical protein J7L44_01010 [Candidatus Diapherotrites archaeon]|nr:hypothetical protein [Candidatus Diapherotrites archaeon]